MGVGGVKGTKEGCWGTQAKQHGEAMITPRSEEVGGGKSWEAEPGRRVTTQDDVESHRKQQHSTGETYFKCPHLLLSSPLLDPSLAEPQ